VASLLTARNNTHIDFGLIFFSSNEASSHNDKYRLVIESARFADQHDFSSIWIPERHFTKDGWLYPNPAVLHAALARETQQIKLHAGSVVLPLHNPLRVAEEWSVVDNLSGGRVGIAFASGWHPNDFALAPDNYEKRQEIMFKGIEMVQRLWRGEKVQVTGGDGKLVELQTYPPPIQSELPFWITAAGNPNTFAKAGAIGANLLTHMYNQSIPELTEKINIYRNARAEHGHDPEAGQISVLLHTFIGKDKETVLQQIQGPFSEYLKSASYLVNAIAYSRGQNIDLNTLSEQDLEDYLHFVTDRLISTQRVLIGTPEDCLEQVIQIRSAGVTEIACQMDFGISTDLVMESMPYLNRLKDEANVRLQQQPIYEREHISISATHQHSNGHKPESPARDNEKSIPTANTDFSLGALRQRCREQIDLTDFYQSLQQHGIQLAESFQGIKRLWQGDKEALGQIKLSQELIQEAKEYTIHPTLLDASLQVLIAALPHDLFTSATDLYLPTGIRSFQMHQPLSNAVWSHAQLTTAATSSSEVIEGDVRILNDQGQLLVEVLGLQLQHTSSATAAPQPATVAQSTTGFEQWLYELQWEPSTLKEPDPALLTGNWLVFADKSGVGQRLIEQLDKYGAPSSRVIAGSHYRELAPGQYQIDPTRPEDTQRVIQEATHKQQVTGIIHLWSLDTTPVAATSVASLEDDQIISTRHALQLIQVLAQQNSTEPPHLWLVTRGAQAVTQDNEQLELTQAPLWGLGKTCAMEHPEFWGGLLDLDPEETTRRAARQLLSGISTYATEDQIAFRGDQSYVARMMRSQASATKQLTYYKDASYLITGGLWGLGLEVARRFAEKGAGHLILLGRSELPARSTWDTLKPGSRQAIQTAGIRALERLGAQVHYAAVDVADEAQLSTFLTTFVQQGYPPLRGVIHAASVWQDAHGQSLVRPLAQIPSEALTAVFRPKVIGSWLLYTLTKSYALDFFVSFSSGASLFGSAAQGNYAAAGEFMDIMAHYQRAHGQPALSIDWGAISEIGFGGTAEGLRVHEYWESRGIQRINPRQVLDTLELLIPQGIARIGVIKLDWPLLEQFYSQIARLPLVRHLVSKSDKDTQASSAQTSSMLETIRAAKTEQWTPLLEDYLRAQVASVLRLTEDQLDNEQPLTAFGLDSLMAIELKNRLEGELALRIPIVTFLQGPSIIQFAQQIRQQLTETIIVDEATPAQTLVEPHPGTALPPQDTEQLLAQLDQLSDQDIDALLTQMMPEEDKQRSNGHSEVLPDLPVQDPAMLLAQIDQLSDEQVDSLLNEMAQKEDLNL
jgi:phthiocerol/phenolphthiocerol synthesis type-I polyketide synthase D